jgi:NTP pyrophosphatase (non-canonical NTP hydrolase)
MNVLKGSLTSTLLKIKAFQQKYFGKSEPAGALNHLKQELLEIEEALEPGREADFLEEVADLVFMVNQLLFLKGFEIEDLNEALKKKLDKNLARNWPEEPDENGVYNHEPSKDEGAG